MVEAEGCVAFGLVPKRHRDAADARDASARRLQRSRVAETKRGLWGRGRRYRGEVVRPSGRMILPPSGDQLKVSLSRLRR